MRNYLPRFTLRRALIAIALLALFLGWLRPDRAKWLGRDGFEGVQFSPMWPDAQILFQRAVYRSNPGGGHTSYSARIQIKD